MSLRKEVGSAIKGVRDARGLTQEDFSDVSSRTYISTLERGLKSPTIDKLDKIARRLDIHPVSLLALCYVRQGFKGNIDNLLGRVSREVAAIQRHQED